MRDTAARLAARIRRRVRRALCGTPAPLAAPPPQPLPTDGLAAAYPEWLRRALPDFIELALMRSESEAWSTRPLISVLMTVRDPRPELLAEALRTVTDQAYTHWELCVADDASTDPEVRELLERAAADPRVRVARLEVPGGSAAPLRAALGLATGEWVTRLDADAALRPHALHRVVERLHAVPDAGVVYSDEDVLLPSGGFGDPSFKPNWSPDLLLATDYLRRLTVLRRDLVLEAGGVREGYDGAEEHDLHLRVTELAEARGLAVTHLAEMLHISRRPPVGSNGTGARQAVADAVARRGLQGTVEAGPSPGWYHVRYALRGRPAVSVVIPTRDRGALLRACIESIETRSTYPDLRLLIVDNGSTDPETLAYLGSLPHTVLRDPRPFNYSELMNAAVERVDTEQVVLLNNDITVITPGWVEAMLEHAQRPEVGAVGCRLLYPDGRPQHEGVAVGVGSPAINLDLSALPPMGRVTRDVSAVTAACMMIRRDVWREVGGMDESLRVAFNDVDLCLRLRRAGYRVVYTPLAELHHHESASRGDRRHDDDDVRFAVLWGHHRGVRDAFVNPNLEWVSPPRLRPS